MEKGRIIKATNGFFYIEVDRKLISAKLRGKLKKGESVVPGDWVNFMRLPDGTGVIENLLPRRNLLKRPAVANIDQLMLVLAAAQPDFHAGLLDKFLVLAEWSYIPGIIIVINKIDLAPLPKILSLYEKIGYPVLGVSAEQGTNMAAIKNLLSGKLTAFAGSSGVGKSSLLNCIEAKLGRTVGAVSEKIRRGRHTTRLTELLPYDDGYLIDTPGFSAINFVDIDKFMLAACFPEFRRYIGKCRFSPCEHTHEPDCAVKNAVKQGTIAESRYGSYVQIIGEIGQKGVKIK